MTRKMRKTQDNAATDVALIPGRDLVSTLPWELIAEILSTTSPKDVLAMARTSRHFCTSLVLNSRSRSIWQAARKHCNPPVPDPTPNFTESSYAACLFDGGRCENCGKFTEWFYASFSLRLRFCDPSCYSIWKEKNAVYQTDISYGSAIRHWLLCSEGVSNQFDSNRERFYRKTDVERAEKEYRIFLGPNGKSDYRRAELYHELHKPDELRKNVILSLSEELLSWHQTRLAIARSVKSANLGLLSRIAEHEGWKLEDILCASSCAALYKRHKSEHEVLTEHDFNAIRADVETEVTRYLEKKARSKEEQAYAKRRSLVALDYHRRKSCGSNGATEGLLPTINVFRDQPVIKSLQNKQGTIPEDMSKKLTDSSVRGMIEDNLSTWRDQARNAFMKILGIRKYYSTSVRKAHPVDRVTARFICSVCLHHLGEAMAPPLDFREACGHQCPHLTKKQKAKAKWSPDQFQPDTKAIKVTRRLLDLLNEPEDEKVVFPSIETTGDRIMCKTCDSGILLNFKAMQRHSHRHDDTDVKVLSASEAKEISPIPIQWGLCAELTSRAKSAPRKAELRVYGCRHCLQANRSGTQPIEGDSSEGQKAKTKKLMSFHGLRCHLLQSHGVSSIGDEDMYRDQPQKDAK